MTAVASPSRGRARGRPTGAKGALPGAGRAKFLAEEGLAVRLKPTIMEADDDQETVQRRARRQRTAGRRLEGLVSGCGTLKVR